MNKLIVCLLVGLAACGGSSVPVEEFEVEMRAAVCRHNVKCGMVGDEAACEKVVTSLFRLTPSQRAAITDGSVEFDGGAVRDCADGLADRSCDATSQSNRELPEACSKILTGTQASGAACAFNSQCVSGVCEVGVCDATCCQGTCVGGPPPAIARVDESCEAAPCEPTAYCDDLLVCVQRRGAGGSCTTIHECQYGLDCVHGDAGSSCRALPKLGNACSDACGEEGTWCNRASDRCEKVATEGEACTVAACSTLYVCAGERCTAGIPIGGVCSSRSLRCAGVGAFCEIPLEAEEGICTLPKPAGEPCANEAQCADGVCDMATGRCAAEAVCT